MFYFICSTFCVACSLISLYSLLNIFPCYGYITICSSNLLLMHTLVISGLGKFLNMLSYAYPIVHLQVFLLAINLIVDLLIHRLYGSSTSVTSNHLTKWLYPFVFYSEVYECFICFTFLPTPDRVRFFHLAIGFVVVSHFIFNLH